MPFEFLTIAQDIILINFLSLLISGKSTSPNGANLFLSVAKKITVSTDKHSSDNKQKNKYPQFSLNYSIRNENEN